MSTALEAKGRPAPRETFLGLLTQALRGVEQDYTEGGLNRAVFLLAVPMVLETLMESVFGVVDVFFVGRLGAAAVAAVGLTESMLTVLYAIGLGLALPTTALVARRIGEKRPEEAARTAVQAIGVGLLVSIPFSLLGIFGAEALLRALGTPEAVVQIGWGYTALMLSGSVTILLLFLINAVFRGAGDAAVAMRSLWLANGINIVLDPCLIFGLGPFPELGLTGAAVATTIGRVLGVAYQIRALTRAGCRVRVERRHLRFDRRVALQLLRLSIGGTGQFLIGTASWLGLMRILTPFGATAVAGYTIALRVIMVTIMPSWGLSNAVATLVGQNLGAGKPERAERAVWTTGVYNMLFLLGVMGIFLWQAEGLIALFSADPMVQVLGARCLRVVSYGYAFYAWGMVMTQAINGAGDTMTPTIINLGCYWLFQIPFALAVANGLGYGPTGVFLAITSAESLLAVVALLVFRRGRWKRSVV